MSEFNLTDQTNLFKINYYKKSANMYNSENVLQGRVTKKYDFTGKQKFVATPMSFSGGVGSGSLPTANAASYEGAVITSKKVYAVCQVEREAIKASANDAGAFVQATKETVKKTVESYMRNSSRILFGDGSGVLGRGTGAAANISGLGTIASPYIVTLGSAAFKEVNFEEKDFVQIVTGITDSPRNNYGGTMEGTELEVVLVEPSLYRVKLVGTSARLAALAAGPSPFAATDAICMQGSYENDPEGLQSVFDVSDAGSGSLYGISYQRRWSAHLDDAASAGITVDRMNRMILDIEKKTGEVPKMVMASYEQYKNILALLEDQKVYNLPNKNLKGHMGFDGVELMTPKGAVGLFVDRFCDADKIWFINDSRIEVHHRPDFGWFDDDGTVFLRGATDSYEARYGGYYQNYIVPTGHGCIHSLAT